MSNVTLMDIIVRNNIVNLKNANLGSNFSNIVADLSIDKYGQVKVHLNSGLTINTSVGSLSSEVLRLVSDDLEKIEKNRIQNNIKKRIDDTIENRVILEAEN